MSVPLTRHEQSPRMQADHLRDGRGIAIKLMDVDGTKLCEQSDPGRMPVEDPRIRWEPAEAPWRTPATLRIPMQSVDSPAQLRFAEDRSYSPWHSVAEHQPLGGVNRCRRIIYHAISELRHGVNGRSAFEPTGTEQF